MGDAVAEPRSLAAWLASGKSPGAAESKSFSEGQRQHRHGETDLSIQLQVVDSEEAMASIQPAPQVVLLTYTPIVRDSFDNLEAVWSRGVDRVFPRPQVIVVGTRVESLGSRALKEKMRREHTQPVGVDEACEKLSWFRAVNYIEVSITTNIHGEELLKAISNAALGEAARRPTPEILGAQRVSCVKSIATKQSVWMARRDRARGRLFYYNRMTGKSVWERPHDYDGEEPQLTEEELHREQERLQKREELRLEGEREKQVAEQYMKELTDFESRMTESETRSDRLTRQVTELKAKLDGLKKQIEENANMRDRLERLKDHIGQSETDLTKNAVGDDTTLEHQLQLAKNEAFELEALASLRNELDYDLQLSENLIKNKSYASRLRELLQDQLQIQKQGSTAQAKSAVASKACEEAATNLARLKGKYANLVQQKDISLTELQPMEREAAALKEERNQVRSQLQDRNLREIDRHRREKHLLELTEETNMRIATLRSKTSVGQRRETELDQRRLAMEQDTLINELAKQTGSAAILERQVAAKMQVLQHVHSEQERVYEKLVRAMSRRAEHTKRLKEKHFQGSGYSPVAAPVLGATVEELRMAHQMGLTERNVSSADVSTGRVHGSQVSSSVFGKSKGTFGDQPTVGASTQLKNAAAIKKFLANRIDTMDTKGQEFVVSARNAAQDLRLAKSSHDEDAARLMEAIQTTQQALMAVQTLASEQDGSAVVVTQPLERLKLKVHGCLGHDSGAMRSVVDAFSRQVLNAVDPQSIAQHTSQQRANAVAAVADSALQNSKRQLKKNSDDYSRVARSIAKEMEDTHPGHVPARRPASKGPTRLRF